MYHDFHNNMEKLEVKNETGRSRQFFCPVCKKRNWRSIETFRLHKSQCRHEDQDKREAVTVCGDCGAEFPTRLEYRKVLSRIVKMDQISHTEYTV